MVVSSDLFLYIFGGIALIIGGLYILAYGIKSWRTAILPSVLLAALIAWLTELPTKTIYIVNNNHVVNSYIVYGSPDIFLETNGNTLSLDEYETRIGGKYLLNQSNSDIVAYPVKYGTPGIFNRKGGEVPASLFIETGEFYKLKDNPRYWFIDAPESISSEENGLIFLWKKIFGSFDIVWIVDDYETLKK